MCMCKYTNIQSSHMKNKEIYNISWYILNSFNGYRVLTKVINQIMFIIFII